MSNPYFTHEDVGKFIVLNRNVEKSKIGMALGVSNIVVAGKIAEVGEDYITLDADFSGYTPSTPSLNLKKIFTKINIFYIEDFYFL